MTMARPLNDVSLEDKFRLNKGRVFINGTQALARISLIQKELDAKQGLNTRGFISGYRGSPLGMLDMTLWQQKDRLKEQGVVFQPGVNEDLAATAVWGTQQIDFFPDPACDGVYSMWYGKAPGVDRSADVLRHGNTAGSHKNGGVLVVAGDDHPGKSSTVINQSEPLLSTLNIPVLYPSNVDEIVKFGLLGWQMSRYTGLWVGLKTVNETVEQTQSVDVDFDNFTYVRPERNEEENINIFSGSVDPQANEVIVKRIRLPLVHKFVRANDIDKRQWGKGKLGIVTSGKSYEDVIQALQTIGIKQEQAEQLGIGIYKVGCVWPLDPQGIKDFANDYQELAVIEEKTAMLEPQVKNALYGHDVQPTIIGKLDNNNNEILPSDIQFTPIMIADVVVERLKLLNILPKENEQQYQKLVSDLALSTTGASSSPASAMRMPYFCSGCPHNTSTKLPDGSMAMAGIGCHGMAVLKGPSTIFPVHMGGEGVNWAGAAPFSNTKHMFQNLGDGTYYHSGLLAIRAAVAANVNITYKILYNDAVAMTGGQPIDGPISPQEIVKQVTAEGVVKCVIVSDAPEKYRQGEGVPSNIDIYHRDDLDAVQKEMREISGVTILLYEQTCAAEKRRRRKRGKMENPNKRLFINDAVCENCGDCSVQSTCVSIQPKATALGVKRQIDQSSCNKDYSCVKGFCPSFVSVVDAEPKKTQGASFGNELFDGLPATQVVDAVNRPCSIMISGIGGTGVITVGAVIGMAAHMEGKACSIYDMTGLSQKNGAVYSHLRIANSSSDISAQRIGAAEADVVLGFDLLAALSGDSGITFNADKTTFIGNSDVSPTFAFQFNRNYSVQNKVIEKQIKDRVNEQNCHLVDATNLALKLCGDTIAANMFVVGFAAQQGVLPVSVEAIEKAIELNGVAVPFNLTAFRLGRLFVHDRSKVEALIAPTTVEKVPSLNDSITTRVKLLTDYQDASYAERYQQIVKQVQAVESKLNLGSQALTFAVAENLAKVMAYKDEYEVARLYTDPNFKKQLDEQFEPGYQLKFNLAPPLLARKNKGTGLPVKAEYGSWVFSGFKLLTKLKGLRGTVWDVFGYTQERKQERKLLASYQDTLKLALKSLERASAEHIDEQYQKAIEFANLPNEVKGFGHVKEKAMDNYFAQLKEFSQRFSVNVKG
ncbi:indolepyruvate ferredoxin oxidoreductase family protein [Colwellia sp. MEBiC06753]